MKLSVIIPVYNCEKYIEDCVLSVVNQTYKNIEIILINDGSNDSSPQICKKFANSYDNIKYISQENMGVSVARNRGKKVATGDLITFVDSDDTIDSDMYQVLVNLIENEKCDIAHCSYKRIDTKGIRPIGNSGKIYRQNRVDALECLITGHLFNGSLWNKIYRRELIESLEFKEGLVINEDILFNIQAFNLAKTTVFFDVSKYNYMVRDGHSITNTTESIKKALDYTYVSQYIYENITDESLKEITVNRYVNILCNLYRVTTDKKVKKNIKTKFKELRNNCLHYNNKISVFLILYFPFIYKVIYGVYDKIRVPNWDVK